MVCAFVFAPLGIVFGHMSLSEIKKTGELGRELAIAGLVISYLVVLMAVTATTYTVLGAIDAKGLAVVDKIAAGGVLGGTGDGEPATEVTIESVRVG